MSGKQIPDNSQKKENKKRKRGGRGEKKERKKKEEGKRGEEEKRKRKKGKKGRENEGKEKREKSRSFGGCSAHKKQTTKKHTKKKTNENSHTAAKKLPVGTFRYDLFFYLIVFTLKIKIKRSRNEPGYGPTNPRQHCAERPPTTLLF